MPTATSLPLTIVALAAVLCGCTTSNHKSFSLPADSVATSIGPQDETEMWPRVFLAATVDEAALEELAPFAGVVVALNGNNPGGQRCAAACVHHVIGHRPDAILVSPQAGEVTTSVAFYSSPFVPMAFHFSNQTHVTTPVVAYAMRALRCRLPFAYNKNTGTVMDVQRDAVAGGLLEGDVLSTIDGAAALPPKDWPSWSLYVRLLSRSPGEQVPVEWVRAGVGKMSGTATLQMPRSPHLDFMDSVDVSFMPEVVEHLDENGRTTWRSSTRSWDDEWPAERRARKTRKS